MFPPVPQILRLPDLRLRKPYTILPEPNSIDSWLVANDVDTQNDAFNHPVCLAGDLASDQVLCTLQLSAIVVRNFHSIVKLYLIIPGRCTVMISLRIYFRTALCYMPMCLRHLALTLLI